MCLQNNNNNNNITLYKLNFLLDMAMTLKSHTYYSRDSENQLDSGVQQMDGLMLLCCCLYYLYLYKQESCKFFRLLYLPDSEPLLSIWDHIWTMAWTLKNYYDSIMCQRKKLTVPGKRLHISCYFFATNLHIILSPLHPLFHATNPLSFSEPVFVMLKS